MARDGAEPGARTATSITAIGITSLSEFAVGEAARDLTLSKAGPPPPPPATRPASTTR